MSENLCLKVGKPKFAPPYSKRNQFILKDVWYKTYVCLSGDPTSPNKGWRDIVHLISHKVYRYRHGFAKNRQNGFSPHSINKLNLNWKWQRCCRSRMVNHGVLKT